jgi:hypothetical protein
VSDGRNEVESGQSVLLYVVGRWRGKKLVLPSSIEPFLGSVRKAAEGFSGIRTGDTLTPLHHPFWYREEIAQGLEIKGEWDVPDELIPFYGDWHTLLCISVATGEVLLLDDARATVFLWESGDDFLSSLTQDPSADDVSSVSKISGIIESKSWLDF